jgi:dipeptidyl aminopeptidase/acylaminoacyl peptidase
MTEAEIIMHRLLPYLAAALIVGLAGCTDTPRREQRAASPSQPSVNHRPITMEQILAIDQAGPATWSPDGKRLAFAWGEGTERDLWTVDASAQNAARPGDASVTQVAPLVARGGAVVSPDWKRIAYTAKQHVWVLPLEGGRPRRVTTKEGKYAGLNWSPDSTRLAFVVTQKDQDDIAVASADGGPVTIIAGRPVDEDSPIWSPASDRLAFIRRFDDWKGYEIWTSTPDGRNSKPIVKETYERGVEEFTFDGNGHWSPDGSRIAYLSSRTGYNHVWVVPVKGGDPTELTTGSWVDYSPRWSPSGDRIAFVSSRVKDLEDRHVWVVNASGGEPARLSPDGFCSDPVWSPDGARIAYLRSSTTEPPEVTVQDAKANAARRTLTESRPDPAVTRAFTEPAAVRWQSKDGTTVPGILIKGQGGNGPRPALMYFHGKGGINLKGWGGLPNYAFHQYLAQRGYAILFVNWRGTHVGYGSEFERKNYHDYGGGELDDVVGAAEFLSREAEVDPRRVACWGGSYGGYMTMLAITKAPGVCTAGISLYGVSDWTAFMKQSKRKLWRMRLVAKLGDPRANPEMYDRAAAIKLAGQATSPLLILQGSDDDGVVPAQGESLYDAMKKAGKFVEYAIYTGEGHGFRHTGSLRDLYTRTENFLGKHNVARVSLTN